MSVGFASLIWLLFSYSADTISRTFEVPIEFRNLPPEWALESDTVPSALVTLTGGPNAGTYTTASDERLCAVGTNETDLWSVQLADDTATAGVGAVQIMIPDTTAAKAGTSVFHFSVIIGSMMQGTDYTIESRPQTRAVGRGTATVTDTGTGARIMIEGVTRDTIQLRAEIRCREVRRGR